MLPSSLQLLPIFPEKKPGSFTIFCTSGSFFQHTRLNLEAKINLNTDIESQKKQSKISKSMLNFDTLIVEEQLKLSLCLNFNFSPFLKTITKNNVSTFASQVFEFANKKVTFLAFLYFRKISCPKIVNNFFFGTSQKCPRARIRLQSF